VNINTYPNENIIAGEIPYCEIKNFIGSNKKIKIQLKILGEKFTLGSWNESAGDEVAHRGFRDNIKSDHVNSNKKLIRVESYKISRNNFCINIKQAYYEQQAKSNLIIDYKHKISENQEISLRDILNKQHPGSLPPLDDTRLANTLGIVTMIFYKDGGEEVPFLAKRARTTGVFNEAPTWHCTSSFAARWQDIDAERPSLFDNMIMRHLKLELLKEAGISDVDVFDLRPLALCRELMRAGKPQMFFIGKTNLTYDVLAYNFTLARNELINNNERPETTDMPLLRPPSKFNSLSDITRCLSDQSITSETAAALHYYLLDREI
jgi:hypothetical protein